MSMSTSAPPLADPPASPSNPERVRLAIEAMGSTLAAHAPVIEVFLEEAPRWSGQLAAFGSGKPTDANGLARLRDALHEIANGMAIAGAAAEAAIVRELEHRLMAGAAEDLHDGQRVAADAERALASAARALKAAIAPIKRQ